MGIFKRAISVDVAEFSGKHVSTCQVGSYIKKLYAEENFEHLGFRFEKNDKGILRVILYTLSHSRATEAIIQYFKDRCPSMIEDDIKKCECTYFTMENLGNGFETVSLID